MRHIDVRKAPCKSDSAHGWLGIFSVNADARRVKLSAAQLGFATIPPLYDIWGEYPVHVDPEGVLELYLQPYDCAFLKY